MADHGAPGLEVLGVVAEIHRVIFQRRPLDDGEVKLRLLLRSLDLQTLKPLARLNSGRALASRWLQILRSCRP